MTQHQISDYGEANQTLRNRDLKQALYEDDTFFLGNAVVSLHGERHKQKRKAILGLFSRDFFRTYQTKVFPAVLSENLNPVASDGGGDLVEFGYRIMSDLVADTAGLDRERSPEETTRLIRLIRMLGQSPTIGQMVSGDREQAFSDIQEAFREFDRDFYTPSANRRQELINNDAELPRDIITTMLVAFPDGALPREEMAKDAAFFILAGAFTQANALTFIVWEILTWLKSHPEDREKLLADPAMLQKFIWESFRLHPPQVVARRRAATPTKLPNGSDILEDCLVEVDVTQANRSELVFGAHTDTFDPFRELPGSTPLPGLTFGAGPHACPGRTLAAGVQINSQNAVGKDAEVGTLHMIMHRLLELGIEFDPDRAPTVDESTVRRHFETFPFVIRNGVA